MTKTNNKTNNKAKVINGCTHTATFEYWFDDKTQKWNGNIRGTETRRGQQSGGMVVVPVEPSVSYAHFLVSARRSAANHISDCWT